MNAGVQLFARYAFAPNDLGYCGPAETATLFDLGFTGHSDATTYALAQKFTGAWPYLALLAETAGIDDPLDERVVRTYWTGGPLLETLDRDEFAVKLIDRLGSLTGQHWGHVSSDLLAEVRPTHAFHVFGIYPWSRMLARHPDQPLHVLDRCRIRWGRVLAVQDEYLIASSRRLTWDGDQLGLGPAVDERVRFRIDGRGFVNAPVPGEWLALHWDWVCDRLTDVQLDDLQRGTDWQLRATNARLASVNAVTA